jgi:integrase
MRPGDREKVGALRPGESITLDGVGIERRADGSLAYWLNVKIGGRHIHKLIGFATQGVTYRQARAYVERVRTEARERRLRLPKGRQRPLTFGESATRYVVVLEATGGKNIQRKRVQLAQHLVPALGREILAELTTGRLAAYRQKRQDEGASPKTVNRELAVISHLFTIATDEKWLDHRPCRVPKINEERIPRVILTAEEQDALMRAAVADGDSYLYLFIGFALNTAMRHTEILRVRFEHIDWAGLRLHVPQAKAGQRLQPLTAELVAMLKREQEMATDPEGWIFPSLRAGLAGAGHRTTMGRGFERAVKRAGLGRHVTPHLARHTAISRLIKSGVDLRTVQAISGHKTIAMLLHYLQTSGAEIDRAMRILGQSVPPEYRGEPEPTLEPVRSSAQVIAFPKK